MKPYTHKSIGLLGGGQLARMLIQKGHEMGLEMHVLCPQKEEPAAQVTSHWHKGYPNNAKDLEKFLSRVDVATFESEFYDSDLFQKISQKVKTPLYPKPSALGLLQDRWSQKKALSRSQLPTAPFLSVSQTKDLNRALEAFPQGFVLKKRRHGYDGYGTFYIRKPRDAENLKDLVQSTPEGFIAEELVTFQRELALLAARNSKGEIVFFPLVESHQKNSRCDWVKGPIEDHRIRSFKTKAKRFLQTLQYVGVVAFELFDTKKGLLINELAPRVHNTGHYSLEAMIEDQFTLHLKALLGAPLKTPKLSSPGFAMANLVGQSSKTPRWTWPLDAHLHWYGKSENRPGRKMGHINAVAATPERALAKALKARTDFRL